MKSLKIGNIKLKNPLFLAPMVDITDLPYRLICRKAGAAMAYTEMIYISAILHKNTKTQNLMKTSKKDFPIGIQITGNSIDEFKKVIPHLKHYDLVDINCGCPSIRITGNQAGSYLLSHPEKISKIIKILKQADLTVTAKIRLGFKTNNVLKVSKAIEKAGADALIVHARLAVDGRSIPADHKYTKFLKQKISIPIIANGDIFAPEKAAELLDFTDGIMIARGAIGDPLIFKRTLHYLESKRHLYTTFKQNIQYLKLYLSLIKKHKMLIDLNRIKYISSNFIKDVYGASKIRQKIMNLKSLIEIKDFINTVESSERRMVIQSSI